jgi:hypothetical protein
MARAYRLTAGAEAERRTRPARLARTEPDVLRLQRLAGNRATAELVQRLDEGGEKVPPRGEGKREVRYRGMARSFELFLDSDPPPYTLQMCALNSDPVGHAWIGLTAKDGSARTIGFWPTGISGAALGPGELLSDDPHKGGQTQIHEQQVSEREAYRALDVIADFDGSPYSLMFRNCADFVVKLWRAVTGDSVYPERYKDEGHSLVWNPRAIGRAAEERNR